MDFEPGAFHEEPARAVDEPARGAMTVGPAADPAEREADRLADRIVAALAAPGPRTTANDGRIRRSPAVSQPEVGIDGGPVSTDLEARIQRARRGGSPLDAQVRDPMEQVLGTDLGHVRLHRGGEPERISRAIGAEAFTVGNDVFMPSGAYQPDRTDGQRLLAHEVAHTLQDEASQVQRVASADGTVIRRLWSKKQLYDAGGKPTLAAKRHKERSTYRQIGTKLEEYEQAGTTADKQRVLREMHTLITSWLDDPDHGRDRKRHSALTVLKNQVAGARRTIFRDTWENSTVAPPAIAELDQFFSVASFEPTDADIDAIGTGKSGPETQRLIAFAFADPAAERIGASLRRIQLALVGLDNLARNLRDISNHWTNAAHARKVEQYFGTKFGANRMGALDVTYFSDPGPNTNFYLLRHLRSGQDLGGRFAAPAFQEAMASVHPEYVDELGQKTALVVRQASRQGAPPGALGPATAAQQAFARHDYLEAEGRYVEARDIVETGVAEMSAVNDDVANPPRRLGGALNEVIDTEFDEADGTKFHAFFKKEERTVDSPAAIRAGMDNSDIRQGNRSIASYRLDQLLGTKVIPRTEWAVRNGVFGTAMAVVDESYAGQPAHVGDMALKTGPKEARVEKDDSKIVMRGQDQWTDASFQRGMSNLQLIDAITGQLDRHPGNIFVMENPDTGAVIGVVGIDNDLAFGKKHTNPNQAFYNAQGDAAIGPVAPPGDDAKVSHNVGIPLYIDQKVGQKILTVTRADVDAVLEDLLTTAEIDATWQRIAKVQRYIAKHMDRLVAKADWSQETAVDTLAQDVADSHSYYAREALYRNETGRFDVVRLDPARLAPLYRPDDAQQPGPGQGGDGPPDGIPDDVLIQQVMQRAEVGRVDDDAVDFDALLDELANQ